MAELTLGDLDPNRNFGDKDILGAISAVDSFEKQGGALRAQQVGISLGDALQRFSYAALANASPYDRSFDFKIESIDSPCLTKKGAKQSPALATFCRHSGILDDADGQFRLSKLGRAVFSKILTPQEYVFVLLSKQGVYVDNVYKDKFLVCIAPYFLSGKTIPENHDAARPLINGIIAQYCVVDQFDNEARVDLLLNAMRMAGLLRLKSGTNDLEPSDNGVEILKDIYERRTEFEPTPVGSNEKYAYMCDPQKGILEIVDTSNAQIYLKTYPGLRKIMNDEHIDGTSHQLITYGAPGTGKSHKTKLETEAWKKNVFRTTFHPDSDYSTFVGAYKPTMKESQRINCVGDKAMEVKFDGGAPLMQEEITYDFVAQAFVKAYVLAWRKMAGAGDENGKPKPEPVFLVIEEINRGNCAQIFGDLFQLLDRDDAGYSEYPIDADADLRKFLAKKGEERLGDIDANALSTRYGIEADLAKAIVAGEKLVLPPNFLIRATMNTSDQSLFPIDSAFKRRWDWEYVPILEGVDETTKQPLGWKIAFDVPKLDANGQPAKDATGKPEFESYEKEWWDFVLKVNEIIGSATHSEDKKLGYFFVKAEKKDGKLIVSDKKILEKVIFYLWNDVFKDIGLGKIFADKDGGGVEFHRFFDAKTGAIDSVLVKEFVEHVLNAKAE